MSLHPGHLSPPWQFSGGKITSPVPVAPRGPVAVRIDLFLKQSSLWGPQGDPTRHIRSPQSKAPLAWPPTPGPVSYSLMKAGAPFLKDWCLRQAGVTQGHLCTAPWSWDSASLQV